MLNLRLKTIFILPFLVALISCSGGGTTTTDAETESTGSAQATESASIEPNLTASVIGPNLNGSDWVGTLKSERDGPTPITATILHEGNKLTIRTSLTGLAEEFRGTISPAGSILVYDQSDGQNWTTYYGNVSKNSINMADLIVENGVNVDVNIIILKR